MYTLGAKHIWDSINERKKILGSDPALTIICSSNYYKKLLSPISDIR